MTEGLEVTGEVFGSAANIVSGQFANLIHAIKVILVATLCR
jgi:ornithine carbamoyltransferase